MSLTSLLANDPEVKALFKTIPNLKAKFKTLNVDGVPFPPKAAMVAPPVPCANPSSVGIAYDYFLRAHIQRINHEPQDEDLIARTGLRLIQSRFYDKYDEESAAELERKYNFSADIRKRYIEHKKVDQKKLCEACLYLAYCESFYRSGVERQDGYLEINPAEIEDLSRIIDKSMEVECFFVKKERLLYNPIFHYMSILVGGADADFMIDDMLVDIKATKLFGYSSKYIRQLIGYYILSLYDEEFPVEINKLGIFYPRYNRFIYISVESIRSEFDLDSFGESFLDIINPNRKVEKVRARYMLTNEQARNMMEKCIFYLKDYKIENDMRIYSYIATFAQGDAWLTVSLTAKQEDSLKPLEALTFEGVVQIEEYAPNSCELYIEIPETEKTFNGSLSQLVLF